MSLPNCVLDEISSDRPRVVSRTGSAGDPRFAPSAGSYGWSSVVRPGVRLGVDVGSVRIGIARCDPGASLASPLDTVQRGPGAASEVARLAAENEAVEVVVGLAVGLAGREGKAAADGRGFASELAERLAPVPVRLVDERFTTVLAHAALRRGGQDGRARRRGVDKAAAALLLQGALDEERSTGEPAGQLVSAGGARR